MNLQTIKKNIEALGHEHRDFVHRAKVAERYYRVQNDIKFKPLPGEDPTNPRKSVHRIASAYYKMLVDEKISYMFGKVPQFDVGNEKLNEDIARTLGKHFPNQLRHLGVDFSNCGVGWLHYWITGTDYNTIDEKQGEFKYHTVDPKQIIPKWGGTLEEELIAVYRHYEFTDLEGLTWEVYEYWDKTFCYAFRKKKEQVTLRKLEPFNKFNYYDAGTKEWKPTNVYKHGFNRVPFIAFKNNALMTSDLDPVKEMIDAYDEVLTQFMDDLADFQEAVWVLSGYGSEPADDFLERLKTHKLIKLESGYPDPAIKPDLETITMEIPYDARKVGLETTRKGSFEMGMGIDQTPDVLSYTSGEALKYRYGLLELRTALSQTECENAFNIFIREIAKYLGHEIVAYDIEQRWTRNKVDNDTELMNNARLCLGFTSLKTALKVNPYVDDVEEELKLIEEEKQKEMEEALMGFGDMNSLRQTNSFSKNMQSSQERLLNQRQSENKSTTVEKYQVGKAVSGADSGRGN